MLCVCVCGGCCLKGVFLKSFFAPPFFFFFFFFFFAGPAVYEATVDGNNTQNFALKQKALRDLLFQQNPTLASLVSPADLDIFLQRVMLESSATVSNYAAKTAVQLLFGKANLVRTFSQAEATSSDPRVFLNYGRWYSASPLQVLVKPSNDADDIHHVCIDVEGSTVKMYCPSTWYGVDVLVIRVSEQ